MTRNANEQLTPTFRGLCYKSHLIGVTPYCHIRDSLLLLSNVGKVERKNQYYFTRPGNRT